MFPKYSIVNYVEFGRDCREKKATLPSKEWKQFKDRWGDLVEQSIKIADWWERLTKEWREKISELPFDIIDRSGLSKLTQVPFDAINEWYSNIKASLDEQGYLRCKDLGGMASEFIFKPITHLKLGDTLTEEDLSFVSEKYQLTPEQLDTLKSEISELDSKPLVEHLLKALKKMQLDPFLILLKGDRQIWKLTLQLEEEQSQRKQLEQKYQQYQEKVSQEIKQALQQQAQFYESKLREHEQRIAQLEKSKQKAKSKNRNALAVVQGLEKLTG
ncbi:MAG: hypothetical protein QNJ64_01775 [Crocosphaera sp.]|nr:hypothetical protein [Crocosphaera sp.]